MCTAFLFELQQRYPLDAGIKAKNGRAFNVSVANALNGVWDLAGVMADIVRERPLGAALIIDLWLPLHVGGGIELTDLEPRSGVGAEGAYGPIHDIT